MARQGLHKVLEWLHITLFEEIKEDRPLRRSHSPRSFSPVILFNANPLLQCFHDLVCHLASFRASLEHYAVPALQQSAIIPVISDGKVTSAHFISLERWPMILQVTLKHRLLWASSLLPILCHPQTLAL